MVMILGSRIDEILFKIGCQRPPTDTSIRLQDLNSKTGFGLKWHSYLSIITMRKSLSPDSIRKLKDELGELEREFVDIDGRRVKPSQCYRFNADPLHVLFNTNCPDSLKKKINSIIAKYTKAGEN